MAPGSDRRAVKPITSLIARDRWQRMAPRARLSIMARSARAPHQRPEIRLQSEPAATHFTPDRSA
jgi:hypothetical protein